MKKSELARRLAKDSKLSEAEAADRLADAVHRILKKARGGREVALPGLGKITPGKKPGFQFLAGGKPPGRRS